MGHLLSSAIKMQSSAVANPTLIVNFSEFYSGGVVEVYKNGTYYGTPINGIPLNVPIVAGDTFYIFLIPAFDGTFSWNYNVNGSYVTGGFVIGPSTFTTTTITASGTNAYVYNTSHDTGI